MTAKPLKNPGRFHPPRPLASTPAPLASILPQAAWVLGAGLGASLGLSQGAEMGTDGVVYDPHIRMNNDFRSFLLAFLKLL